MFILNLTYKKEITEVEKYLEEHKKFLDKNYIEKRFICSGRKEPRTGGIILCSCEKEKLKEIVKEDPFYREGIATYDIIEFEPTKYCKEITSYVIK